MDETRGVFAGPVTVTVLVPAHNEEVSLPETLASLRAQTRPPERVIVVADNCTDATVALAEAAGAEVVETVDNSHKKAGALNQVLAAAVARPGRQRPGDGDGRRHPAQRRLSVGGGRRFTDDRALMAVGGLFRGESGHGLIGQLQRNEYIRYEREVRRRRGRVFVLTGTASLFRSRALRTVADSRGRSIPGTHGRVYDTAALTEDNELTIAIKSLGGLMVSPRECTVVTELMPSSRTLWAPAPAVAARGAGEPGRLRGDAADLPLLGPADGHRVRRHRAVVVHADDAADGARARPLGVVPVLARPRRSFMAERIVTVWPAGWRGRLLAIPLLPELFYDLFLDAVYVKGVLDISIGRTATWKHVAPTHSTQVAGR